MSSTAPPRRVFISYTGDDLRSHADVVADVVRKLEWVAIDHRDWVSSGNPSVEECRRQVESCGVLVVLVAHRYGWVPPIEEGGDGESSITWLEVKHARSKQIPVLPFLIDEDAPWNPNLIEGYGDPVAKGRLDRFKAELKRGVAGFFKPEAGSLDGDVTRALLKKAGQLAPRPEAEAPAPAGRGRPHAEEAVYPWNSDPNNPPTLRERFDRNLPKRILSLDGEGVFSALTFGYLERIEQVLRARYGSPDFLLRDYFDLIGGTGYAAVVATLLALGHDVSTARRLFSEVAREGLARNLYLRFMIGGGIFSGKRLARRLSQTLGDTTLGDARIKTGLCVVATHLNESRPHAFLNHPDAPHSLDTSLAEIVRAGVAMPVFYEPVTVRLGGEEADMGSGEVSVGSDPALYLLLVATGAAFPLRWRAGKRRLFMLSVGAGEMRREETGRPTNGPGGLSAIVRLPSHLMKGSQYQTRMLVQSLAWDPTAAAAEGGEAPTDLAESESFLTYRRYDVALQAGAAAELGLTEIAGRIESVQFAAPRYLEDLFTLGQAAGARQVRAEHFGRSFDVRRPVGLGDPAAAGPVAAG